MKTVITLVVAGCLLGASLAWTMGRLGGGDALPGDPSELIGRPAPVFTLMDAAGKQHSLADDNGQVVLLNFWASWCPPCVEEIPSLDRLTRHYADKDVVVLAVNVEGKSAAALKPFLDKMPHSFAVLLDEDRAVAPRYGIRQLPETFLLNRSGVVVKRFIGGRNWMDPNVIKTIDFVRESESKP